MNTLAWTQEQAQFCSSIESDINHRDLVLTSIQHDSALSPSWVVTSFVISGCSALLAVNSCKVVLTGSYNTHNSLGLQQLLESALTLLFLCISAVGEFRKLALMAEADGHLRQKLQQVLKLSKEKWDDARDHAMRAVVADNRMRIWYADKANMEVGLLFTCRLGNVDLDRPVGMLLLLHVDQLFIVLFSPVPGHDE